MIKSDLIYSTTKTHPNVTITLPADVPEPSMTLMSLVVITKVVVISIPNFILIIHDLKLVFLDRRYIFYIYRDGSSVTIEVLPWLYPNNL